jgi:hypothetical protein
MSTEYRLKFIADETFAEELRSYSADHPDELRIERQSREKDATQLGFDLTTVDHIVVLVGHALTTAQLAAHIFKWWQKSKSNKLIIQSPSKALELAKSAVTTAKDIETLLDDAKSGA